jgi:hypothetical protein
MDKKREVIKQILKKMIGIRNLADWFLVFVDSEYITEKILDSILHILYVSIKEIVHKQWHKQFEQTAKVLQSISEKEYYDKISDQDLDNLLSSI